MNNVIIIEAYFDGDDKEKKLAEMKALVEACDSKVVGVISQNVSTITPATFIGQGKVLELKELVEKTECDVVVFDGELSPSQTINVSEIIDKVVITRTNLILDIFARRAKSSEGKVLVELAQLKYIYPRLKGKGDSLSRLGGGIGTRGPGETKLETDRRHIRNRIKFLENKLEEIEKRREIQTNRRAKNNVKIVALVGYTNTGKSTLLNKICKSDVLELNQVFATLDPSFRAKKLFDKEVIFVDTVGFISKLPDELMKAFKSTLDVVLSADLVVCVADASGDYYNELEITHRILDEIKATSNRINYLNKCDLVESSSILGNYRLISAKSGLGLDNLLETIYENLFENRKILHIETSLSDIETIEKLEQKSKYIKKRVDNDKLKITYVIEK